MVKEYVKYYMGGRDKISQKSEFPLWLCKKLSQDLILFIKSSLTLLNNHLLFCGSGIRTGHNKDSLLHDVWALSWMT